MTTLAEAFTVALRQHQAGNLHEAEHLYRQILQAYPDHADTHHLVGVLAFQRGQFDHAVASIRHALVFNPQAAVYLSNLGLSFQALGQIDQAVECFQQALRARPDFPEAHNNLGALLIQNGKSAEALDHCRAALRLRPTYEEAHNNLGNALQHLGKTEEAIAHHREALRLNPNYADALNNLGVAFQRLGRLEEAVAQCTNALLIKPDYAEAHNNLGMALRLQGNWDEALVHYQRALQLKPDYPDPHWNEALVWLVRGDFERGWPEYEWRWTQPGFLRRSFPQPLWDGSDLNGRTILLHTEQGLGDTLHFVRYASVVHQRGGRIVLECQPPLLRLLAGVPGIDRLVAQGEPLPEFDVHAPLLGLPAIFRTTVDTIPAAVPYLHADDKLVQRWRKELESLGGFKVGIAWQGNPGFLHDLLRSIPLKHFARLAQVEGVRLVSLQKGPGVDQLGDLAGRFPVLDLGTRLDEESGAFMDTAAVMVNLDLVITSDTAIPHLAGGLGVPVWLALALSPDWRWLLERADSPWYPTMRLFRQTRCGDWDDVFERMAEELSLCPQLRKH
jgi:tetratricopeptide (TPR) repeat protein